MTPTKREAQLIGRIQDLEDIVRNLARSLSDARILFFRTTERLRRIEDALRKGFEV